MIEPENLVLAHSRELRADMNARFDSMEKRFEARFEAIETHLDRMHRNGLLALKNFIGHRTMTERAMASSDDEVSGLRQHIDSDISELKRRVDQLEDGAMNWISEVVRPKIKTLFKRESPDKLWVKCPETGQMVFHKEVEANCWVIPGSDHHLRINATQRLKIMFDTGTWLDVPLPQVAVDPLKFRDEKRYADRLKEARAKTGLQDAFKIGYGRVDELPMTVAVQDFSFMGGSLGMAAGEAFIKGAETAVDKATPYVLFAAAGGARMQEGILSLMQMPRTTIAVRRLRAARLPYVVVLTDPTTGGVTASYAMLGDVHIAEPGALIGFAGPRVIEQTIREKLPDGFQRAEYLKQHGMVDMVVHRRDLKATVARLCRLLTKAPEPDRTPSTELAVV